MAWQRLGVDRTPEALRRIQEGVSKVTANLSDDDQLTTSGAEIDAMTFLAISLARDEIRRWDSPEAAVSLLTSAARAVGLWEGVDLRPTAKTIKAAVARIAAHARHAEDREKAESIKSWYRNNCDKHHSMDTAAEAVTTIMGVAFRTARKHIGEEAKELRSARTA